MILAGIVIVALLAALGAVVALRALRRFARQFLIGFAIGQALDVLP